MIIGMTSLYYTNMLVKKLEKEERKRMEIWALATRNLTSPDLNEDVLLETEIIIKNNNIPVMLVDEDMNISYVRNLDARFSSLDSVSLSPEELARNKRYLKHQLEIMQSENDPIEITMLNGSKNYIYHKDSMLLKQLFYYPFIQLAVIFLLLWYPITLSAPHERQNRTRSGLACRKKQPISLELLYRRSLPGWNT